MSEIPPLLQCSKCGASTEYSIAEKLEFCQDCWERHCDEAFWAEHQRIARIVNPDSFPKEDGGSDA